MTVYRVFTGWMGNGCIHRIVVAESEAEAMAKARASGMVISGRDQSSPLVELVKLDEHGVEAEDQDL